MSPVKHHAWEQNFPDKNEDMNAPYLFPTGSDWKTFKEGAALERLILELSFLKGLILTLNVLVTHCLLGARGL